MTITQAVERQFTLMRRATAGGRGIRLASLLGAVVGPARRGVLPPFLCSRSQPHGQQVGGRRVGCAASGRPVRSPPTWPNSRGLRRTAESGGRFPRSLPPWIRHDRDVNRPEPGLPLIGCVTRRTRSRCMAGHPNPSPPDTIGAQGGAPKRGRLHAITRFWEPPHGRRQSEIRARAA